jgi:GH18 family chitinase
VGVSNNKIVPGAAFYGKSWMDVDSLNAGLFQSAKTDTTRGRIRFKNYLDYSDVIKEGFRSYWDDFTLAPWLYNPEKKIFWTFDDVRSIALKARYVGAYNLRGLMFWAINGDDTLGTLVSTIYNRNMPEPGDFTEDSKNDVPSIDIIEPNSNSIIAEGSNVIIKTNTNDKDGKVVKVEFFIDGNSIGYNTFPPYNWAWFNAPAGKHKIEAAAIDNNGGKTRSQPVEINIKAK